MAVVGVHFKATITVTGAVLLKLSKRRRRRNDDDNGGTPGGKKGIWSINSNAVTAATAAAKATSTL